jgi:hypothetical protein
VAAGSYLPPFAVSRKEGSYFGTVPKAMFSMKKLDLAVLQQAHDAA